MANKTNSIIDTIVDAQKKAVENLVESTAKLANGNTVLKETVEKGGSWYSNLLDKQKEILDGAGSKANEITENVRETSGQMNDVFNTWFNNQIDWTRKVFDAAGSWYNQAAAPKSENPFQQWMSYWENAGKNINMFNNWHQMMNQNQNWFSEMQKNNPFTPEKMQQAQEQWVKMFNDYFTMSQSTMKEWADGLQNNTTQDVWKRMVSANDNYTRFQAFWAPMWKSIQENSFNAEVFKKFANPELYKDMMDSLFGFVPEDVRKQFQQFTEQIQQASKQFGQQSAEQFANLKNMFNGAVPSGNEYFDNMLNGYNYWNNLIQQSAAPIAKMVTPNAFTKQSAEWNEIMNNAAVYNIKNAALQYMIYAQGSKVMDALVENTLEKISKGEEINSMMALYQEWLNISDKEYVSLFESDEYSKLMAEVSALQLKVKKGIELQAEAMLSNVPVATRSEMDEVYKSIYELKKQVRQLEKMLEMDEPEAPAAKPATKSTRTARKS